MKKFVGISALVPTFCLVFIGNVFAQREVPRVAPDYMPVIRWVHNNIRDVNGDGQIDCIDYAVLFKQEFDRRNPNNTALIIRNINRDTGMNHLLNAIIVPNEFGGGLVQYIEPQALSRNGDPIAFWGNKYEPTRNMDETREWTRYIR